MNARHAKRLWSRLSVLGVLLILLTGSAGLFAQPAAPPPSQSQVIAQGVEDLFGGTMRWDVEEVMFPAGPEVVFERGPEFLYVEQGQVLLGNDGVGDQFLSENQATWVFRGDSQPLQVIGDSDAYALRITFSPSTIELEDELPLFEIEHGRYNQQLTRGVLIGDQIDTFTPVNDISYIVIVLSGTVMVEGPGAEPVERLDAGYYDQLSGEITLTAGNDDPATYLIASIGEKLPDLPEEEDPVGKLEVFFYECGPESFAASSTDQCVPVDKYVPLSLQNTTGEVTEYRADAVVSTGSGWITGYLDAGELKIELTPQDGVDPPAFSILRNATERDGSWYVTIADGETTVISIMMYSRSDQETGSLSVTYMECPGYWGVDMGYSECWMAEPVPNLVVRGLNDSDIPLTTQDDALYIEPTIYQFDSMPIGRYRLELDYFAGWDGGNTLFLHDAWHDGFGYVVDILPETPHSVMIVRVIVDDGIGPTIPTGYVVITQNECIVGQESLDCEAPGLPWEVTLTSLSTGDVYWLTSIGYEAWPGGWYMEVPVGEYAVDVPGIDTPNYEFTPWVEVFESQESYIDVIGYP